MVNVKFKRAILAVSVIFAMVFTALFAGGFITAGAIEAQDKVILTYSENRNAVMVIDDVVEGEPKFFKMLKQNETLTDSDKLVVMDRIVDVAKAYAALTKTQSSVVSGGEAALDSDDALKAEADAVANEVTALYNGSLKLKADNYLTYDSENAFVASVKALSKKYDLLDAKITLVNEYNGLKAVNTANGQTQDISATNTVGYYDTDPEARNYGYGLLALNDCLEAGKEALNNSSDYAATVQDYVKQLNAVAKNVLESVYNDYLVVTAYERGALDGASQDVLANNRLYKKMGECEKGVSDFWAQATPEVQSKYATVHSYLENYFEAHQEYNGLAESKNSSKLTYEAGGTVVMTVSAYVKDEYRTTSDMNIPAKVFAPNAKIQLYAGSLTAEEKTASALMSEKNAKLGVGYLFRFNVYGGKTMSTVFDTVRANEATEGGVIYVIELNLKNYYENVAKEDKGLLGELLGDFIGGVWGAKDKTDAINKAYELIDNTETDLCYFYKNGKLTPFDKINYDPDGGILMLETTAFGNFAIAAVDGSSDFFTNPLNWLFIILGVIVLLVVWAIVRALWKYSVKFNSNGGSQVKKARARKGEYFVMPANPVRTGYVFTGWYEDKELTKRFVATRIVRRKNLKAYAKWSLELTPDRVNAYYNTLRNALASHGALAPDYEIEEGKTKTFAVLTKGEKELKLYLALDQKVLESFGYEVTAAGEGYQETPALWTIDTREAYVVAQKLVAKLIENYNLGETEYEEAEQGEDRYVLAITAAAEEVAEEEVVEETTEEEVVEEETTEEEVAQEETTEEEVAEEAAEEEVVEEATEEEVVEETAEEEVVEEATEEVTEEQLVEYFTTIRNAVCGYALYEKNDKAEDGKMLIKLYKKDDAVYCYMALDADSYGLESVGLGFSDTPALLKVANDADLEMALSLVEVLMLEHGFEKSEEPASEKAYDGKSFGYRIHYIEE